MAEARTISALNRLLTILSRSFPMYLTYAPPWSPRGDEDQALVALRHIVADEEALCERIAETILDLGGQINVGEFPMQYTDLHDLSVDFVVRLARDYQKQDIAAIERCVDDLRLAPVAKALAQEAIGMAKGHLESLEELDGSESLQPA